MTAQCRAGDTFGNSRPVAGTMAGVMPIKVLRFSLARPTPAGLLSKATVLNGRCAKME
jgi:hypothetical protein